ncbi:carbohydrate ABC transporter permease [Clostridium sp. SYSU_GA19001]|uniref:carbohydrate ABC transporter permease n=1 Tax=Clostridium caldaquaticum TaxID=2940653 RepID=UPI0020777607|nr:carbohydrate ABC transporter permease [Clostridium caldaquaticum]MCM8711699.1 carbohydrate ABC transporter permease [Clostridium caldaquaticum]
MVRKKGLGKWAFDIFNYVFMLSVAFICIAPLLHVFFMAISDPGIVNTKSGIMLWPEGKISFNGFRLIFRNPNIIGGYINTIFYVVVGTSISMLFTVISGYVLSRKSLKYRNVLMFIVTFTMLFNGGLIPFYLTVKNIGLLDSRWSMLIPSALNVMNIIIMRTAFLAIPDSLEESARLDGANDLTILFVVLLPLVKATVAVIALFYAVGKWNEWFFASIFLKKRELYPLQLFLREILLQNQNAVDSGSVAQQIVADNLDIYKPLIKYATILVSTVPILCIYPFVQKYFVKGVMIGSIKG